MLRVGRDGEPVRLTVGVYEHQILPRLIDKMLGAEPIHRMRAVTASSLSGTVVEVGFGSGLNVPHYPPAVERVLAVDPAVVGQRLAAKRLGASTVPVEFVGLDGEDLPMDDDSVDAVLCTFTLCTIPDADRALGEIRRVLRAGGTFHFLEHGLNPDPRVAAWQHRLNGVQRCLGGGCNLDRPIDELIERAGLTVDQLDHPRMAGPQTHAFLYQGVATSPG